MESSQLELFKPKDPEDLGGAVSFCISTLKALGDATRLNIAKDKLYSDGFVKITLSRQIRRTVKPEKIKNIYIKTYRDRISTLPNFQKYMDSILLSQTPLPEQKKSVRPVNEQLSLDFELPSNEKMRRIAAAERQEAEAVKAHKGWIARLSRARVALARHELSMDNPPPTPADIRRNLPDQLKPI